MGKDPQRQSPLLRGEGQRWPSETLRSLRRKTRGSGPLCGQVAGRGIRLGPLLGEQAVALVRVCRGFGRDGCSPPL